MLVIQHNSTGSLHVRRSNVRYCVVTTVDGSGSFDVVVADVESFVIVVVGILVVELIPSTIQHKPLYPAVRTKTSPSENAVNQR